MPPSPTGATASSQPSLRERVGALRNIPPFLRQIWGTSKPLTLVSLGLRLVRALLPIITLYVGKLIIDEAVRLVGRGLGFDSLPAAWSSGALDRLGLLLVLEFALAILSDLLGRMVSYADGLLSELFTNATSIRLMEHAATLDLEDFEDPDLQDKLDRARRQTMGRMNLMGQLFGQVQDSITVISFAVGLMVYAPWLMLLLAIALVPAFVGEAHFNSLDYSLNFQWTPERRQLEYLRQMGASVESAKEVKIFNLNRFFIARFRELSDKFFRANRLLARKRAIWGTLLATLGTLGYYVAYAYIAWRTVKGDFSIGDLTFLAGSFRRLRQLLEGLLIGFSQVAGQALYLDDLFSFFEIQPEITSGRDALPIPRPIARGFTFENVGFRYPGAERWALRGLDLRIEAGERVMLLGASGSGKSTLLSGLAGLLEGGESEGLLRVDGLDPRAARERTGIVFQDPESSLVMARAGDEVAFGLENRCVPPAEIWPRVDEALEMVGFPYGRERPTDALSGGEQQRLALAAALALRPGLLLLDEPTANLDPAGAALVRDAIRRVVAGGGLTMLMVEHRVGEAMDLVDRVIVLEAGGGVIADGPPNQVFARRGDELAAAGIWVPNHPLPMASRPPRSDPTAVLTAQGVGYRFPGEQPLAVGPIDLEVRSSEALAIVGPNGCGKSTLALLLGGLLRPSTGSVTGPRGEEVWRLAAHRLAQFIGSVFQDPEHQFLAGTVREELALEPGASGKAAELMERLHLSALAEANPFTLSGGEKRRLSVATALVGEPSVLILDEPTFGQDRRTAVELLDLLSRQRDEGAAVCFVTHDLPFAAALADRTLELGR